MEDMQRLMAEAEHAMKTHPCNKELIRPDQVEELRNYAEQGTPLNECLVEVVSNNLIDAVRQADDHNLRTLAALTAYVHNDMPSICHGSKKVYRAWLAFHQGRRDELGPKEMQDLADKVSDAREEALHWRR